jgi:hypothetical protein
MKSIKRGFILPSAAYTIAPNQIKYYNYIDKPPEVGDVVYGTISRIGEHSSLENKSGRIHMTNHGTRAIFVFGNRYAPDYFEGLVPAEMLTEVDLLARSGVIGEVRTKSSARKDPTRVTVLGYVCDGVDKVLNTRNYPLIEPKANNKSYPRSKMILVCGTSMNSGKSRAAIAGCWALATLGHTVRASKVTGTASLKDVLHMNDAGANPFADFTFLGYPSTYLLPEAELIDIFNCFDLKYANSAKNYWVVELADGIVERETAMLLASPVVQSRIHKLIFCANDALGAIGGLEILKTKFNLAPDAISGVCSSSPLHIRELAEFTDIPVFNSMNVDLKVLKQILD